MARSTLFICCILFACASSPRLIAQSDPRADSLRVLALQSPDHAQRSDQWLALSKHFRKLNLDSSRHYLDQAINAAQRAHDQDRYQRCKMSEGALLWMQGDYPSAERNYQGALGHWFRQKDSLEIARCLLNLGTVSQGAKKNESAIRYLRKAVEIAGKSKQDLLLAQAAGTAANVFFQLQELDSLNRYSQRAISGFQAIHDSANLARAYGNLGFYNREMGRASEAHAHYLQALVFLAGSDELGLKGEIHDGIGTLAYQMGQFEEAIQHLRVAHEAFEQMGWTKKTALNDILLGLCFKTHGRIDAAKAYFSNAYRLADSIQEQGIAASALSNLADMDRSAGDHGKAIERYRLAIELERGGTQVAETFHKLIGLALSFQAIGSKDSTRHYLTRAFAYARAQGHRTELGQAHLEVAALALAEGNFSNCISALDSAKLYFASPRHPIGMRDMYRLRSRCLRQMGNYVDALDAQLAAEAWQDSSFSANATQQLLSLEAKYWTDKQRHALELAQKNEAIRSQEAAIALETSGRVAAQRNLLIGALVLILVFGSALYYLNLNRKRNQLRRRISELRMASLRAQMNPHFIFNALGAVQLLIHTKNEREASLYLSKFARLLRVILERSSEEELSLEDEMEGLAHYLDLEALRFQFQHEVQLESGLEPSELRIPSMLLQPMVENAVKHGISSKQEGGKLTIAFKRDGDDLLCSIEDNGVGRAEAAKYKKGEPHTSMGLKITAERLSQLQPLRKDRLQIVDLQDAEGRSTGTRVEIRVPYHSGE